MEDEATTNSSSAQEPKRTLTIQQCSNHKQIDLSLFCRECNKLICPVCLTEKHQKHEMCDIDSIHTEKLNILKEQQNTITNDFVPFFSEESSKLDTILQSHQDHIKEMKKKIEEQDRKLKEEITRQTTDLLTELDSHLSAIKEDVINRKSKLEDTMINLNKQHNLIEETIASTNIRTICKNADDMLTYIKKVDISAAALPRKNKHFNEGETKADKVASLIGALYPITLPDTATLNFKVVKSYTTNLNAIGKVITGESIWIKNSSESVLQEIKLEDELKEIQLIKNAKVRDMAMTKSGDLLLAMENKSSIKVIKKGSDTISNLYDFQNPWFGKPQVPVALHAYGNNIIAGTLEKGGNWDTLTDSMPRRVVELTESGEQLQVYEFDSEGNRLFTFPHRITSSCKNENIIILDKASNRTGRIIALDMKGKLRWIYDGNSNTNGTQPFDPWDMVVTTHDNIIVCDMRNHALHILNCDGQIIKYQPIEPLGITLPGSIGIDNRGILILGCGTEWRNEAKIHSLIFTGC